MANLVERMWLALSFIIGLLLPLSRIKIIVPLSYSDELYALRNNIHLVRKKLLRI